MVREVFQPSLLTRRDVVIGGSACLIAGSRAASAGAIALPRLSQVQPKQKLEISIGSLVGRALGVLIYQAFAKAAPAELVSTFAAAIIRATPSGNMALPARDYVDFRVEKAKGDLRQSNIQLAQDMKLDFEAFRFLADAVRAQSQAIERMRNDSNTTIRAFRTELAGLRKEIGAIRSEQARSQNSTAIYGTTGRQMQITRVDKRGSSEKRIANVMRESDRLQRHCRDLEDQILRGQ